MYSFVEQQKIQDEILHERLEVLLPKIMKETDTECWLIACREYNEDPLYDHLTPAHVPTARRLSMLLFAMKDDVCLKYSLCMPDPWLDRYYTRGFDRTKETQMEALQRLLYDIDPKQIAVNISKNHAFTDGLSAGMLETLKEELPEDLTERFVSAEKIGIRLMETRTELEKKLYPEVVAAAMSVIEEAFSDQVIIPGRTTCRDVMDFMAEKVNRMGLTTWFEPDINLQNADGWQEEDAVINKGDLVHCDFGITYLKLNTDHQRNCYILRDGEEELPEELKDALRRNNRFQDIVREQMKPGRTGNDVFTESVRLGKEEGIRPMLYTHPLGLFGHGPGPIIGLYTDQNPQHPRGDLLLYDSTAYALELNTLEYVPMYQRDTYLYTEESVLLENGEVRFLAEGRDRIKVIHGGTE